MPTPPYAKLRVSVNGGAPQTGGIVVPSGALIALSAESTVGWSAPAARWEIYAFPEGWTGPGAPWTSEAVPQPNGKIALVYKCLGTQPPPPFFMPTLPLWGKFMLRLFVNGGMKSGAASAELNDQSTALEILSPSGLHDLAWREGSQFGGWRSWVAQHAQNLRVIDAGLSSIGGGVQSVSSVGAIMITGTAAKPVIEILPASDVDAGSLSPSFFTALSTRTSAATPSKIAERDGAGGCAFTKVTAPAIESATSLALQIQATKRIEISAKGLGFFAAPPIARPTVTGSRGGNAALGALLTALANLGLIINNTTP